MENKDDSVKDKIYSRLEPVFDALPSNDVKIVNSEQRSQNNKRRVDLPDGASFIQIDYVLIQK